MGRTPVERISGFRRLSQGKFQGRIMSTQKGDISPFASGGGKECSCQVRQIKTGSQKQGFGSQKHLLGRQGACPGMAAFGGLIREGNIGIEEIADHTEFLNDPAGLAALSRRREGIADSSPEKCSLKAIRIIGYLAQFSFSVLEIIFQEQQ